MNNLFVYLEIEDGSVHDVSLELLTKGRSLANQLGVALEAIAITDRAEGIADTVMPYGVDKLHLFVDPRLEHYQTLHMRASSSSYFSRSSRRSASSVRQP